MPHPSPTNAPLPFVLPLVKVDARTGEFVAKAALEVPDDARELCDYAASRPHFERLEKRCLEESGGKKVAPLRAMHQLIAAGNVTRFDYDDGAREITCFGKITDAESLLKAIEGTYCGVSMGGLKKYLGFDPHRPGVKRYMAIPNEISLVDLGAIPGTGLTMLNAAGGAITVVDGDTTEQRTIPGLADRLAKVTGSLFEFEAAVHDAVKRAYGEDEQGCPKAWTRDVFEGAVIVNAAGTLYRHDLVRNADGSVTLGETGVPVVVTYVPVAQGIDGSFGDAIRAVGDVLAEMAREEEPGDAPMANATDALRGHKSRMQKLHNIAVELGAACGTPMAQAAGAATPAAAEEEETMDVKAVAAAVLAELLGSGAEQPLQKALGAALGIGQADGPLAKAIGGAVAATLGLADGGVDAEGPLAKAVGAATQPLRDELETLKKAVAELAKQPEPAKGALFSLTKGADGAAAAETALAQEALRVLGRENPAELARLLAKQPGNAWHVDTQGASPLPVG